MINKYKLNKIARHLQCTIRNNIIEHYFWAYNYIQSRNFRSEQKKIKALSVIDQCLTPGKYRNNHRILKSFRELRGLNIRYMEHVLNFRVPATNFLADEIKALEQEFDEVIYSEANKTIQVVMGPIELNGVQFGQFQVTFSTIIFGKVFEDYRPRVVALEPNYPPNVSEYSHPHVSGHNICVGDGEAVLNKAVAAARILDCFTIIHSILNTYGREPYLTIEAWTGQRCPDCDNFYDPDDSGLSCESCDGNYCENCVNICCADNDSYYCYRCRRDEGNECYGCNVPGCNSCVSQCNNCSNMYCRTHINGHHCVQQNIF